MVQTRTLHRQLSENGSQGEVVIALAAPQSAAVGTLPTRRQAAGDLPLDYDLLNVLEDGFALGQCQAQRFRLQIVPLDRLDFANLLAAVFGDHDNLNPAVHSCTSR
jgi:hypothetical protein